LAAALEDEQFSIRFEAARGMAQLQHPAGLEVLVQALEDAELRFRALGALALLNDSRAVPAIRRVFDRWLLPPFERTQAAGALARLGDEAGATHLLARTRKRWSPDRALAVELAGEVHAPGALERLSEIVVDSKDTCRGAAARGLGRLGDPKALAVLEPLVDAPGLDDDFRLDIAEGLCLLGGEQARVRAASARAHLVSTAAKLELDELLETFLPESRDETG
jgi:HEAT repeat protein